jgi:hypothetical protein
VRAGRQHEPFHAKSILEHFYAPHKVEFDIFERTSLALKESYASLVNHSENRHATRSECTKRQKIAQICQHLHPMNVRWPESRPQVKVKSGLAR